MCHFLNNKKVLKSSIVLSILLFNSSALPAQDNQSNQTKNTEGNISEIRVTTKESNGSIEHILVPGETHLSSEYIKGMPTATTTINELLRGQSNVQFSQSTRDSASGGEIAPPKVSIYGSKHYENSFLINGVSNNNNINPSGLSNSGTNQQSGQPSGEAQSLFLDTSLVDTVSIFTENISAEHGGFVGSVIDAKLRDARIDRWGGFISYRYTNDSWAKFHFTENQENSIEDQSYKDGTFQPRFSKRAYTISLDGPITDNLGLMLSYGRQESKIPQWSGYYVFDSNNYASREQVDQYRKNENFLFKLNTYDIDDFKASFTAIYAPYTQTMFSPIQRNSNFDIKSGGLTLIYDMENRLQFGNLKNTINYQFNEISRDANTNIMNGWRRFANSQSILDWSNNANASNTNGTAQEGAYGDYKQKKHSIGWKSVLDFDPVYTGILEHNIKVGFELEYTKSKAHQDSYTFHYFNGVNGVEDSSVIGDKNDGILEGYQYSKRKVVGWDTSRTKSYSKADLFLEDTMKVERFTIRPGVRLSYDSITHNTDIAPRFFANVDVFNDDKFNIFGGYNRYYGSTILALVLNIPFNTTTCTRNNATDPWNCGSFRPQTLNNLGELNSPYSDEFNIGMSYDIWDTLFKVNYINKEYRDGISKKRQIKGNSSSPYIYTNDAKSDYWGLTFAISKNYNLGTAGKHSSEFSATRSIKHTNSVNELATFDGIGLDPSSTLSNTHVTYNGQLIEWEDLPAANFNSPWIIAYTHMASFDDKYRLFGVLRWQEGGVGLKRFSSTSYPWIPDPDGKRTDAYETVRYKNYFNIDLSAEADIKIFGNTLTIGIDVLNLMNKKNDASVASGTASVVDGYSMGRQFYANFRMTF